MTRAPGRTIATAEPGENARMDVVCFKCWAKDYEATGRFNESRFGGHRRAELRCRACGFKWSSGLPDALELGDAVAATLPDAPPERERLALQTRITGLLDDIAPEAQPTMTTAELETHRKRAAAMAARSRT